MMVGRLRESSVLIVSLESAFVTDSADSAKRFSSFAEPVLQLKQRVRECQGKI
jgi:hypothetical protein